MKWIVFVIILICVYQISSGNLRLALNEKKAFVFDQFMVPCQQRKFPVRYENMKFYTTGPQSAKFLFDYDFVIDKDSAVYTLIFKFKKCPSPENLDACTTFRPIKTSRFCGLMKSESDAWSPMMTCATPRIPCPYKKGIYLGRNCTLDMESFKLIPLGTDWWHLELEMLGDGKELLLCLVASGRSMRI